MKKFRQLTNEYASNLVCHFINMYSGTDQYYNMFKSIFKKCTTSNKIELINSSDFLNVDIVFIEMDKSIFLKEYKNLKIFMQGIRKNNEFLRIYLIQDIKNSRLEEMHLWYEFDGSFPLAFDRENTYQFLYRTLKRITAEKALDDYVKILENQLFSPYANTKENENKVIQNFEDNKITTTRLSSDREKDLRFSQIEKISATEFINSLDDTIIDKVESFTNGLDALISSFYELESASAKEGMSLIPIINDKIKNIELLIESMFVFPIIARSFSSLNDFLSKLREEDLIEEKKSLLTGALIGIITDLEKWIDIIFVSYSTEDIHYFDASFSSNIHELENMFVEEDEEEDGDEDDLEFF